MGWDTYRHLDQLPGLPGGVQTKQFSSFDRAGGNGDFAHCLAQAADGCVIADATGAGEVESIWFTRDGGDVRATGDITIQLDGTTVLHAPLQDVVDGTLGAPFTAPLVADADQSSGGVLISVPMPYRQSMRIVTDADPIYYHVTYRTFSSSVGVQTFDPSDPATDVVAELKAAGTRDPKSARAGATTQQEPVSLAPGGSATVASEHGAGAISAVQVTLPQLRVALPQQIQDDGRAFGAGGSDSYTAAIDPANTGVRITRRLDPSVGNQRAAVQVDGQPAGAWAPLPANGGQWQEQSIDIPAALTAGKSSISVTDSFVSSDLDYNAFTYWVDSTVDGTAHRTDTIDVGPAHTATEKAHDYLIVKPTWEGEHTYSYPPSAADQAAAAPSDDILAGTRLQISFDGNRTVDAPLGEFFGSGLGGYRVAALMSSVDPAARTLTAWWPMPYRSSATVTLVNGSHTAITGAAVSTTAAPDPQWARRLSPMGDAGYFRATANNAATTPGQDFPFLDARGTGKFVGVSHTMTGVGYRGYLEGDERVYVDGARTPQIHGTGTEDFYEGGWYFNRDTFTDPLNGESGHEAGFSGCPAGKDCTSTYREMIGDAVPFTSSLRFGIEHGGVDEEQADYASTAFWYGQDSRPSQTRSDSVDLGDPRSRAAHQVTGVAATSPLSSTFEGDDGPPAPVTDAVASGTGPTSFRVAVAGGATGVRLVRTSDQNTAYQSAEVSVDGVAAGSWLQPLGNSAHRWLDDSFDLPPATTAGKRSIVVTITPSAAHRARVDCGGVRRAEQRPAVHRPAAAGCDHRSDRDRR